MECVKTEFLVGPQEVLVVKNLSANAGDVKIAGFIPGSR